MGEAAVRADQPGTARDPLDNLAQVASVIMERLRDIQLSDEAREALRHPKQTRVTLLSPMVQAEIAEWSRVVGAIVLYHALAAVQIDDVEAMMQKNRDGAENLVADKRTAWEWFFKPWQGHAPRLSLESVCEPLHLDPDWVRRVVRRSPRVHPPVLSMPPGHRYDLFRCLSDEERVKLAVSEVRPHPSKYRTPPEAVPAPSDDGTPPAGPVDPPRDPPPIAAVPPLPAPALVLVPPPLPLAAAGSAGALDALADASTDLLG